MFLTASSRKKKQTESRPRELPWSSRRRWMAQMFFSATVITSHNLFNPSDVCRYDVTSLLKMGGWVFNLLNLNPRISTNTRMLPPPQIFLVFIFLFRVSFPIHYSSFPYSSHYFLLLLVTFPLRLLLISLLLAPILSSESPFISFLLLLSFSVSFAFCCRLNTTYCVSRHN